MDSDEVKTGLSRGLIADYEALQNDLEQARNLANDYQCELSSKSNDIAALKLVLEKTSNDLLHLQGNITALRAERHRLANEAQRGVLTEYKLTKVTEERDFLQNEVQALRSALQAFEQSAADLKSQAADTRKGADEKKPPAPSLPPAEQANQDFISLHFDDSSSVDPVVEIDKQATPIFERTRRIR